jgi:hypothetical protein
MSSTTQEQLLSFFREAAGTNTSEIPAGALGETPGLTSDAAEGQSESATPAGGSSQANAQTSGGDGGQSYSSTQVGTSVSGGEDSTQSTGGTGSTIESALTTFMEGGLGIVPLVSGLIGLFGGDRSAPPRLEKYQHASSVDFLSADTPNGLEAADYDQLGMPRLAETALPSSTAATNSPVSSSAAGGPSTAGNQSTGGQSGAPTPQMTLNIQAMDAQSIMDRSGDIAQAVRSAMLNMSSINDVISDL